MIESQVIHEGEPGEMAEQDERGHGADLVQQGAPLVRLEVKVDARQLQPLRGDLLVVLDRKQDRFFLQVLERHV